MLHMRPRRHAGGIPTSSLADIAFLLLIFFLVTTVFDEEKGLSLVLPPPGEPVQIPPDNMLLIDVMPDGIVQVRRGVSPHIRRVAAADVAGIWITEVEDRAGLIAVVRTDPAAPYHRMIDVLDALRQAGAKRISLRLSGGP